MHVDGFRFDLASVLARNPGGSFGGPDDPLLTAIRADPILREVHLIAEPWDAAGAYRLGTRFPGPLWQQWNDRFRDDVRRFVRGGSVFGACADDAALRQRRPLPRQPARRPPSPTEHQLPHLPRRFHTA
jgi:pullulanase/glycogen debranching enzyme